MRSIYRGYRVLHLVDWYIRWVIIIEIDSETKTKSRFLVSLISCADRGSTIITTTKKLNKEKEHRFLHYYKNTRTKIQITVRKCIYCSGTRKDSSAWKFWYFIERNNYFILVQEIRNKSTSLKFWLLIVTSVRSEIRGNDEIWSVVSLPTHEGAQNFWWSMGSSPSNTVSK